VWFSNFVTKHEQVLRTWTDTLLRPQQWKRDLRFGTWNVRSLHRSGSLTATARELARYKLVLVGVQEVRCDKGGNVTAGDYIFFYGKGNENHIPGNSEQKLWDIISVDFDATGQLLIVYTSFAKYLRKKLLYRSALAIYRLPQSL